MAIDENKDVYDIDVAKLQKEPSETECNDTLGNLVNKEIGP